MKVTAESDVGTESMPLCAPSTLSFQEPAKNAGASLWHFGPIAAR